MSLIQNLYNADLNIHTKWGSFVSLLCLIKYLPHNLASGHFSILFLPGSDEDLVLPSSTHTLRVISLKPNRSIKLIRNQNTNSPSEFKDKAVTIGKSGTKKMAYVQKLVISKKSKVFVQS